MLFMQAAPILLGQAKPEMITLFGTRAAARRMAPF
jgi:hypothetical protein